jgi:hypothetical protein
LFSPSVLLPLFPAAPLCNFVTYLDSSTPGFLFHRWGVLPGVSSRYVGLFGLPFPPRYVRSRPHPRGSSSMETLCKISKSGQMNEVPKCKRSRRRRRFSRTLNSIFSTCCTTASPTTQEITARYKKHMRGAAAVLFSRHEGSVRRRRFFVFLELVPAAPARSAA